MDLQYKYPVVVNFNDRQRIQAKPVGNEIVLDSKEAGDNYYRADSRLGSVYIDKPGNYYIQVVSEKVMPESATGKSISDEHTRLKSLILKPMTE